MRKIQRKIPVPEPFLIQLQASAYNFIKKETVAQVLSSEFREILKYISLKKHLRAAVSGGIQ